MSRTPADAAEDATSGDPSRPRSRSAHRWRARLAGAFFTILIVAVGIVLAALAAGYRPVVIQTGSMGDTAPPGSLIVAVPRQVSSIGVDDILVMRRPGATPVTHRIIEIEQSGAVPFAITKGDANESPDAAPYPLDGEQLVARWIAPGWGGRLETVFQPGASLTLMAVATAAIAFHALRRIWITPPPAPVAAEPVEPRAASPRGRRRQLPRRRLLAFVAFPLVGLMSAGVAFAMFVSGESVAANDFTTAACFDPQLSSVQNGESIHAVDGVVTVPITAVDPAGSFVMASVRSASNEPADATVQVVLRVDGAALELSRNTDAGAPPPVTVAWSVVEYGCGASVQRGTVVGNGTTQIDIPVASVNQAASFVLATSTAEPTATDFGGDDLFIAELTSATNLRLRATGAASFDAQRSFSWQVVSFADPADASVQTITGTLPAAAGSTTLTIPSPVDTETTFLLTSVNSTASGADIGKRLVRATLTDSTTITIDRGIAGEALDIQIQVVALNDGTTVRHGTVDFTAGQPARTIAVDPVDVTRSSVVSTVAIPGLTGGGMTDHIADDIVGEASATFILTAADTLSVVRDASASNASFAWQVIEWAGPQWWDPAYSFRQRIDVDTSSVAAPNGYTVPLDFDHAALVSAGLSRSDGTDVRVVRWDGSSWTELDRVLDDASTWNAVSTTIWFKTVEPIAADTTSTYWLYIGNSSPGAVANDPEAVYLLTENFDSGTLGDFEDRTGGTGWYQADPWTRRIPLTVSAALVPSTLTDVPLQIAVTDADLSASAQTDGSDFRFTAADGVTLLDHEIESWDSGTGALVAWVRVPSLSSSADSSLYLYYGAADAPAGEQIHNVWSSGFGAAWHLGRDPAGDTPQIDDATIANRDGLSAGSMTSGDLQPAQSGSGLVFDGVDDRA
ncbi:MAG: signal peptidase I, partial [Actinomycetia bacterium]|nr:signal peptidase I [Actinomycetes bacterium]